MREWFATEATDERRLEVPHWQLMKGSAGRQLEVPAPGLSFGHQAFPSLFGFIFFSFNGFFCLTLFPIILGAFLLSDVVLFPFLGRV